MHRLPVRSVNLGTGVNGLHPEFRQIVQYLRELPIRLTMTSNGYSVAVTSDKDLCAFKDIELSLHHPTKAEQDGQRGEGNWDLLHERQRSALALAFPSRS